MRSMDGKRNDVLHSGGLKHERGVEVVLNGEASRSLLGWEAVSDRIWTVRLQARFFNTTIIQVYAPTNTAEDGEKNDFYEQLQGVMDEVPGHDMKILMGDFNAQIGPDREGWEEVIGGMADGERTDNGERLMSLCSIYNLKIGGSFFRHRKVHKQTWRSPDGKTCNQIDHICVQGRWMSSLRDVRVYRGADVASDHHLLVAKLKVKLKTPQRPRGRKKNIDVENLGTETVRKSYQLELKNRFTALEIRENEEESAGGEDSEDMDAIWERWRDAYRRARRCWGSKEETEKRLGFLKRRGTQSMKGKNVNKGWSRQGSREQGTRWPLQNTRNKTRR